MILLGFIWQNGHAQDSQIYLTFEQVLQLAGADNLAVQEWQQRYELALAEKKSAAEWWVPSLYGGTTVHQLTGATMNSDGIFYLNVNRQNFWGGIGANVSFDFGNGIFQAAAAKQRAIAVQYQSQDEKNKAILSVAEAYFDLQAAQAKVAALGLMAAQSERIAQQLQVQKEAGFTYASDVLMAQSNLNHQKIAWQQQEARRAAASLRLVNLLNLDENTGQVVADTNLVAVDLVTDRDVAAVVPDIYDGHPAYKSAGAQTLALQKERNVARAGLLLPKLYAGYSAGTFGDLWSPTDRQGNPIGKLYNTTEFNGGLLWQLPLNDVFGGGRKRIYDARLALAQNRQEQVKNEVQQEVQTAKANFLAAKASLQLAEEGLGMAGDALEQSIRRQQLRTAKPYEVFQSQEIYLRAQKDFFEAMSGYNKAQCGLYVALGRNLEN